MALDPKFIGKKYGPTHYEVGLEKMREFAYAVAGGVPSNVFDGGPPPGLNPLLHDTAAAKTGPYSDVIAFPSFAVTFAMKPFADCVIDPELGINFVMLVHGSQEFEFLRPVRAGDRLTTVGTITEIYSKSGMDFLVMSSESVDAKGEPVVRGKWTAVIRG